MSGYGFTSAGTSYDDEDRLTGYARTSGTFTQSWNLTKVGDWTSVTTNGTAQNRTHGPTHELLTAGGQNISTDVKGNITLLPLNLTPQSSPLALIWDFDNKLRSADLGNNSSVDVNFQYDALGRRVARTGTGGSVVYVQHDQQTIADYPVGGVASTPTYRYVYASYIDEPVVRKAAGTSGTIHYYHRNQQYSITAMTTSTGAVAERYAYTAYGQPAILNASGTVLTSSAVGNRYTYTGREWDETLGLHHFRARWMSPLAGRFLGRDPIEYEGSEWGLYESLDSNALTNRDPRGLAVANLCTFQDIQACRKSCEVHGDVYLGTICYDSIVSIFCISIKHRQKCCFCAFAQNNSPACIGRRPNLNPCDKFRGKIGFPPIIPAPFDAQIRGAIGSSCTKEKRDQVPLQYRLIAAKWYEEVVNAQIRLCRPIENVPKDCYYRLNQARARFLRGETDECPGGVRDHCPELGEASTESD
jgi:RHS repeat-associated protein